MTAQVIGGITVFWKSYEAVMFTFLSVFIFKLNGYKVMSNRVALIESHLQLECAIKYVKESAKLIDLLIVRKNGVYANDSNIEKMLADASRYIEEVVFFEAKPNNKYELLVSILKLLIVNFPKIILTKDILIGDYRSKWMRFFSILSRGEPYFLEDGSATISYYYDMLSKGLKVNIITSFSLVSQSNCKVYRIKKSKTHHEQLSAESIAIVGAPVVEKNFLEKDVYMSFLNEVKSKFPSYNIYYFPHRYEDEKNVNFYSDLFSFSICNIDEPIEEFYKKNKAPKTLVGLYSTALININEQFYGVDVYFKKFNVELYPMESRVDISRVYKYMLTSGISEL
ncbi:hypothetical protein ACET7H_14120 [Aeromonas veronii]|uniref:hypothetical protein n=1 Tax=Aeromonas veronii TaxID=654 RepID=UPI0038F045F2